MEQLPSLGDALQILHSDHAIASDFYRATSLDFESAPAISAMDVEPRRGWLVADTTYELNEWLEAATCQTEMFGLIHGEEHTDSRLKAAQHLYQLYLDEPTNHPPRWVKSTWDALWWAWGEELKGTLYDLGIEIQSPCHACRYAVTFSVQSSSRCLQS